MAKRARIDPGTWSAYEKGIRYPRRPERLRQIAQGLGVDVAELQTAILEQGARRLGNREPAKRTAPTEPEPATPPEAKDWDEVHRLLNEYTDQLSHLLREILLLLVKGRPRNP